MKNFIIISHNRGWFETSRKAKTYHSPPLSFTMPQFHEFIWWNTHRHWSFEPDCFGAVTVRAWFRCFEDHYMDIITNFRPKLWCFSVKYLFLLQTNSQKCFSTFFHSTPIFWSVAWNKSAKVEYATSTIPWQRRRWWRWWSLSRLPFLCRSLSICQNVCL